jgi:hypothetical protein
MANIPIYRGKKIDSDEYVEGFLNEAGHIYYDDDKNDKTAYYIMKNMITECEVESYFDFYGFEEIDPSTLSIHFNDMLASDSDRLLPNGEKDLRMFASLSKDGKGGDIVENTSGEYKDGKGNKAICMYARCGRLYAKRIKDYAENWALEWVKLNAKTIGIQQ